MRWKIVLEGTDEFGSVHRSELTIDNDMKRLSAGEISCATSGEFAPSLQRPAAMRRRKCQDLTSRLLRRSDFVNLPARVQ